MSATDPMINVTLTLAGLTYRGFYYRDLWHQVHDLAVRRAVQDGLRDDEVRAAIGDWQLVWGPATHQIGEDFDASAMCVVRNAARSDQLVVAVRGTNPLSFTDWIGGDLDVATLIPWPFDEGTHGAQRAQLSRSTASGLKILLRLESPEGSALAQGVEGLLDTVSGFVPEFVAARVRRIPVDRVDVTLPLQDELARAEKKLVDAGLKEKGWNEDLKGVSAGVKALVGEELGVAKKRASISIGWPPRRDGAGSTLVDFLRAEAKKGPLDIIVTGHSKGGALAPALALWLVETRDRWDPTKQTQIGCYAFAGPTPGNGAFGRRVGSRLDRPSRRVVNTNDVVTHAWDNDGIGSIPDLYDGEIEWLRPVAEAIQYHLRSHDYEPVDIPTEQFQGKLRMTGRKADPALVQIVHQHLEAYLGWTGLVDEGIDALKLLLG